MTATHDRLAPVRTYQAQPGTPSLRLPPGACDAHVHVFGPRDRYPYSEARPMSPVEAPREALFALHRTLGIERCVIVQSMMHGHDNRVVEDAIAAGQGRYLGVALVAPEVPDAELARLARAGFRGVRFNFMRHLRSGADVHEVLALTPRLAAHGLHLQVHFESSLVHELAPLLARSEAPVVIDHMGRVDARLGPAQPEVRALLRLLDTPGFWIKLSGIDRIDAHAEPQARYAHGVALAREIFRAHGDRCVWGTDWPHPSHTHIPDDAVLVDALAQIVPDEAGRRSLLVDNPQRLYRFD
ncbi:MAG: amidohydrolase family protein [Pseudomonadota bacterium]